MVSQQTSEFSYIFREDYDYRSYLEKKSHFDRVEIAVDSGIKNLVASNEALAQSQLQATNQLGADIRDGFEGLSVSLDAVGRSIEDLRSVCEHGFAQIDLSLNYIDQSIQQLVRIAQTPDQTWALEQYSIAKDAFRKNLVEEAIDYVNRAVSGYGERSGYRLEHRFYILRGLIRLGNYKNFSPEVVNLGTATEDFLLAAKYAEHDNSKDHARSLGLAGWASYCDGRMGDAEKHLRRSVEVNAGDDQSKFELSKVLFHLNKKDEALEQFSTVLRRDWKYGLRAGSDDDFLKYRADVEGAIDSYVDDLRRELSGRVREYDQLGIASKQSVLRRHGLNIDRSAKNCLEKMKSSFQDAPISDLAAMKGSVSENLEKLRQGLMNAKSQLRNKASGLRNQKDSGFDSDGYEGDTYYNLIGVGTYIVVVIIGFSNGLLEGIGMLIVGIPLWIFAGFIGQHVLGPVLRASSNSGKRNQRNSAAAELERDLAQL